MPDAHERHGGSVDEVLGDTGTEDLPVERPGIIHHLRLGIPSRDVGPAEGGDELSRAERRGTLRSEFFRHLDAVVRQGAHQLTVHRLFSRFFYCGAKKRKE